MISKLRIKLTIYNTVILILFLFLFSIVVYILMDKHVFNRLDKNLALAAERVEDICELPAVPVNCIYILRDEQLDITNYSLAPITQEGNDFNALTNNYAEKALQTNSSFHVDVDVEDRGKIRILSVPVEKNGQKGIVQVLINIDREISFLSNLLTTLIALNVFSILLLGIINWLLVGKSLIPVKESWQQQKNFIADASHELRTPLSVIQANMDVLISNRDGNIADNMKWLNNIQSETAQMSKLTNDLLLLAKKDTKQIEFQKAYFNLAQTSNDVVGELEASFDTKKVKLEKQIENDIYLFGDELRIRQLLLILLDNALKYTPPGGKVQIFLSSKENDILIKIKDTGIGLADEEKNLIFHRFYRADQARSKEEGGFGLGLSIGSWILEEHGGKIQVETELGKGSSFNLTLPIKYVNQ